ncbi:MAG: hypothetical protein Kow0097_05210 [Candidatus Bipolaricaulota bacterium]|nr:hypothetical protein [Candidatus Bipolaricaulota bacterium]
MIRRVLGIVLVVAVGASAAGAVERAVVGLGSGGFLVGRLSFDLSPLSQALTTAGYPAVDGPVVVFGGGGGGGALGGAVLGGLGFGGTASVLQGEKRADLEFGFGGFLVEIPRQAGDSAILAFGTVIGGGDLTVKARARVPVDFADALAQPPLSQFSLGFFGSLPYLRLQVQVFPWLAIEGWGGYFIAFPGQWEEGDREIAGPKLDLRAPFFGLRISFGGIGSPVEPEPETSGPEGETE